jgi:hypothetical protein
LVALLAGPPAFGKDEPLTIYDIQFNTVDGDASVYDGQVVNCAGGICVGKYAGTRPRLILQDPNYPNGWGGIQVKDGIYPYQMFNEVQLGDWVEMTNMLVEEFRGTTLLQRQAAYNPGYNITSHGNPLPPPLLIPVSAIPAPIYDPEHDTWYVENHAAEMYESMRLVVRDVTVTAWDLGKAVDNYNLHATTGEDCWATDYMNQDVGPWGYHPFVAIGQHFCAVGGVLEQYTYLPNGWDYYQLVTLRTVDLAICGDGNSDGLVDTDDFSGCADCFTGPQCAPWPEGCDPPAWTWTPPGLPLESCLMMDFDYDGDVDLADFADFQAAVAP